MGTNKLVDVRELRAVPVVSRARIGAPGVVHVPWHHHLGAQCISVSNGHAYECRECERVGQSLILSLWHREDLFLPHR